VPRTTPIKRKKFEKFPVYVGCEFKRQKSDHLVYDRPGLRRSVIITTDKSIPVFIIRNNLRTLGIDHDEYLEILKRI